MDCIILVHPVLSTAIIFEALKRRGYKIFSIITTFETTVIDLVFLQKHSDYIFQGSDDPQNDLEGIQKSLKNFHLVLKGIINGIDSSIYYCDYLVAHLLGYSIDLDSSKLRLNKYLVNDKIAEHAISHIPSVLITRREDIKNHAMEIDSLGLPFIAKPADNTAGMSCFKVIHNLADLDNYMGEYFQKSNRYYKDNLVSKVLLQKLISSHDYDEYTVDFISFLGQHYCVGIIKKDMQVISKNYRIQRSYNTYTVEENPEIIDLINYTKMCLDALNVKYGFTNNEIFWDGKRNFFLIESNNRIAGIDIPNIYHHTYGINPVDSFIDLLEARPVAPLPIQRKAYSTIVHLYNFSKPSANDINIHDISSFKKIVHFRNKDTIPQDFYKKYTRVDHINACILISNISKQQLQFDLKEILKREESGKLFV